jgi:CRISPR system Cascade subunit CasE
MFLSRIELGPRAAEHEDFWREISQPYGAHQALWKLVSRGPEQRRDFLFRSEDIPCRVSFLVLSAERPVAPAGALWRLDSKEFAPAFRTGQSLAFRLRASPVVRRGVAAEGQKRQRVQRHDVVMDSLKRLEASGAPIPGIVELAREAGLRWLTGQATRGGFRLAQASLDAIGDDGLLEAGQLQQEAVRVDGYRQHRILRRGEAPIRFSTLDFEGLLEVTEPAVFLARIAKGFGPQKAFGCGLMLLRRV